MCVCVYLVYTNKQTNKPTCHKVNIISIHNKNRSCVFLGLDTWFCLIDSMNQWMNESLTWVANFVFHKIFFCIKNSKDRIFYLFFLMLDLYGCYPGTNINTHGVLFRVSFFFLDFCFLPYMSWMLLWSCFLRLVSIEKKDTIKYTTIQPRRCVSCLLMFRKNISHIIK